MKPEREIGWWYAAARMAARLRPRRIRVRPWPARETAPGISVVIPSRNGRLLLAEQMPGIARELETLAHEIIVVDNGSDDGTADWLRAAWPKVKVEVSAGPLSFARAVNRGMREAGYARVCLLNNDMILEPGFFTALARAFDVVPELFCATAQIRFPPGVRREETGKAVYAQPEPSDFPIRCDVPLEGEDLTWVLYGSGGCSLYDTAKMRALGGIDQAYDPAYVEDLDIGYRAWLRNWSSVYVAGAVLEHRHRATSSRYYTEEQLDEILEVNYLRFIARAVAAEGVFAALWTQAIDRLKLRAPVHPAAKRALHAAAGIALRGGPAEDPGYPEDLLLALGSGAISIFPGDGARVAQGPLAVGSEWRAGHGGGILVVEREGLEQPPQEVLAAHAYVVVVARTGGKAVLRAAVRESVRQWHPAEAHLEAGMEWLAPDCAPARTRTDRPPDARQAR